MEIMGYRRYRDPELDVRFWRTSTGAEVDFILGDMRAAIEMRASRRVHEGDLRGLAALAEEHRVGRRIVVCLETMRRRLGRVEVLPWQAFVEELYAGKI